MRSLNVSMCKYVHQHMKFQNFAILIKWSKLHSPLPLRGATAPTGPWPPHYRGFTITLSWTRHTRQGSSGRVISPMQKPLLTTQSIHKRETSMSPAGFETAIPASERPQAHALDRSATGIDNSHITCSITLNYNPLRYFNKWYTPYRALVSNSEYFNLTDAVRCFVEFQYWHRQVSISTKVDIRLFGSTKHIRALRGRSLTSLLVHR